MIGTQHLSIPAVHSGMGTADQHDAWTDGGHLVRAPQSTDAIASTLTCAFGAACLLPDDMVLALDKLDRRTPRPH